MMKERQKQAEILIEALPYIKRFNGQTLVVKYGGNAMTSPELKNSVMKDIFLLSMVGLRVVLVHGGGPDISNTLKRLDIESKFIDGLRYTDAETMDVASTVLAGKVNKALVGDLHEIGAKAFGISGVDGGTILAKQKDEKYGFVGEVEKVNPELIELALENGFIPVIATVGIDENGQTYNINADTAAAEIAAALHAEKFILLTDIRGVLRDKDDEESLIPDLPVDDIPELEAAGVIAGGMIPKIAACVEAMDNGLKETVIIDGRINHSILLELFSDQGIGTLIHN